MGRYGVRSKLAGGLILLASLALTFAASPAAALPKPERKAVDIKRIEALSTSSGTYLEIGFKGSYLEYFGRGELKKALTSVQLSPGSGPTTVITDRKSSRKPKEGRSGTEGPFDVVRTDKTVSILVEELPVATANVVATISGPGGQSRVAASRGLLPAEFDKFEAQAGPLETVEDINDEIDDADLEAEDLKDELNEERHSRRPDQEIIASLRAKIFLIGLWIDHLVSIREGLTKRQCNDGVDNGDPEDTIIDHPTDPGCVEPVDNDEKDVILPVTCPAQGARTSPFAVINTPQSNAFTSLILRTASTGQEVLNSPVSGTSSAPAPLPGDICGPGVDVTYQWVVFTDGDPFSLPDPPPGDHGLCLFLDVRNPAGSGNTGGQDASLIFAVGTTPQ